MRQGFFRRGFLQRLGFGATGAVLAPSISEITPVVQKATAVIDVSPEYRETMRIIGRQILDWRYGPVGK